ncbi:PLD nuclease N-terminal domain-containing protein [Ornithinibacillus salinisoli]|uniref:PLD nuclease N-terminal domain-containing protein n=1 Tax=Ornithinibacillus salinisoli TaxID=1848459 RepID=A0ABW4VUN5_9BACI
MELLNEINWAVIAPILVIQGILIIIALIDLIRTNVTNGPKWLWVLIILFVTTLGPIIYFIFGRRQR